MPKTNNVTRGVAAAGLLAAFAQLAVAQPAHAGEQAQESQPSQEQQVKDSTDARDGLVDLIYRFYDRLFDSQNN